MKSSDKKVNKNNLSGVQRFVLPCFFGRGVVVFGFVPDKLKRKSTTSILLLLNPCNKQKNDMLARKASHQSLKLWETLIPK